MRDGALSPMGGAGGIVEIDETYIGRKDGFEVKRGSGHKNSVLTLVERDGKARSFHVEKATKDEIIPIVRENMAQESHVMTDEAPSIPSLAMTFPSITLSNIRAASMAIVTVRAARRSIPTPLKAITASSSAE